MAPSETTAGLVDGVEDMATSALRKLLAEIDLDQLDLIELVKRELKRREVKRS